MKKIKIYKSDDATENFLYFLYGKKKIILEVDPNQEIIYDDGDEVDLPYNTFLTFVNKLCTELDGNDYSDATWSYVQESLDYKIIGKRKKKPY